MVVPHEVFFDSEGVRCAADLYWPEPVDGCVPCVVMGHGGSGTKRLGLPKYAVKFAGMAVLAFDYRHFWSQRRRAPASHRHRRAAGRAAVRYARSRDGIDPDRIALWGTSLSGGHVLAGAATDPAIAAVVSQVPLIDGWHPSRTLHQRLNWNVTWRTVQFTAAAVLDLIQGRRGKDPYLVPVVAGPGRVAVFTEPYARAAFEALGERESVGATRSPPGCSSPYPATARAPRKTCTCPS